MYILILALDLSLGNGGVESVGTLFGGIIVGSMACNVGTNLWPNSACPVCWFKYGPIGAGSCPINAALWSLTF